jgi:hypothetical protein
MLPRFRLSFGTEFITLNIYVGIEELREKIIGVRFPVEEEFILSNV